ncbi:MAG: ATP-binding protein, partial [bacterium]
MGGLAEVGLLQADEWDENYEGGKTALQRGEWQLAAEQFKIALTLRPEPDAQAANSALKLVEYLPYYYLGQAYFFAGNYDLANQNFQKSVQAGVINTTVHLVRLQRLQDIAEKFVQLTEQKKNQEDQDSEFERQLAQLQQLIENGDFAAATQLLRSARNRTQDKRLAIVEKLLLFEREETASKIARQKTVDAAGEHFSKGLDQFLLGRYEDALREFRSAERLDPSHSAASSWIEKTQMEMRRINLAEIESDRAKLEPRIVEIEKIIQETPAPVFALLTPKEPTTQTRSESVDLRGRVGDDQGVGHIEFTVNGKPLVDSTGQKIRIRPAESDDAKKFFFIQRVPLQLGENQIVLTAYDVDSTVHRTIEQLTVHRRPPIYQTAGFYLLVAAMIVIPLGIIFIVKVVKYRLAIVNKYNPYIAGAPIRNEEMFFGREKLIKRILNTIHNNSLMIYGPRRIGKTSLQHQLRRRLESFQDPVYRFLPVMVDLQGISEERFFSILMEEIAEVCKIHLNGGVLPGTYKKHSKYSSRDFAKDLKALLHKLNSEDDKTIKLVLLIDEVDELNKFSERANQKLRSVFMKTFAENLVAIMSGAHIRKTWESEGSPWYNFFEQIEVAPLEPQEAIQLIQQPVAGIFSYDSDAIEKILEYTMNRPYAIQRYCVNVINRIIEERRRRVTRHDVEA